MSKLAQCPDCGTRLKIPDVAGGKTVRCTNCGAKFPIARPASALRTGSNAPAAAAQIPEAEGGSSNVTLWVVGCLAVLFLCILLPAGGGAAWFFFMKPKANIVIDLPNPEDIDLGKKEEPKSTPEPKDDQNK
jgi:hypothetical protein